MMSAAGGLADVGLIPVVTTFAVFCVRAVEQARLSIAYPNRNVKIFASHPGLDVGPDGASAQCLEDLAIFRSLPNFLVLSPADPLEMELATKAAILHDGPVYVRTGRSPAYRFLPDEHPFRIGQGQVLRRGTDVAIIACGTQVYRSLQAADLLESSNISASVINMPTIKPIDTSLLSELAGAHSAFVVTEDHNIHGGLYGAVCESLAQIRPSIILPCGVGDVFGESGEPEQLAEKYGLLADRIAKTALEALGRTK